MTTISEIKEGEKKGVSGPVFNFWMLFSPFRLVQIIPRGIRTGVVRNVRVLVTSGLIQMCSIAQSYCTTTVRWER